MGPYFALADPLRAAGHLSLRLNVQGPRSVANLASSTLISKEHHSRKANMDTWEKNIPIGKPIIVGGLS